MSKVASDSASALKCDLASDVLRTFGSLRFAATGWSMLPSVWPGDTLVIERITAVGIQIGEVVLIKRGSALRAHRVVRIAGEGIHRRCITQGDSLAMPDAPAENDEILGRVAHVIRGGKLMAVPAELSTINKMVAKLLRRSTPAARALVYFNRLRSKSEGVA